jgi:hypothetical protein
MPPTKGVREELLHVACKGVTALVNLDRAAAIEAQFRYRCDRKSKQQREYQALYP